MKAFPVGKHATKVKALARKLKPEILGGTFLAIDPSSGGSSLPGWAVFEQGKLKDSGTIFLHQKQPIQIKLADLCEQLQEGWDIDLLVIEEIRGAMAPYNLQRAIGATIAGLAPKLMLEIPVNFWKCLLPTDYVKSDQTDAEWIGWTAIALANNPISDTI